MIRITILFFILLANVYSQTWSPLGNGISGDVYALTVYNGELIAGGSFSIAGSDSARNIARWNGTSWSPLGSGLSGPGAIVTWVYTLLVYNNELIVGGRFDIAGGVSANYIAKWNGTSWSPLGSGMGGGTFYPSVGTLTIYNGELIAGGGFTTAGGVSCNRIAKWNGTSWSPLGSGMDNPGVGSLTVYNNELIAGGNFTTTGGVSCNRIAKWNGTSWSPLGSGIGSGVNDVVSALIVFNTELIAGGSFTTAGGVSCSRIAKWNGTSWSPLGSGIGGTNPVASSLAIYNNELIVGGQFTTAGGNSANYIAKWNGTSWSLLGSGMGGAPYPNVQALVIYNNDLIAGGRFTTSGGIVTNRVAKWVDLTGINNNTKKPDRFNLSQNYPNPFNPITVISYQLSVSSFTSLKVYDALGKEISTLVNEQLKPGTYEVEFDGSNYPSGVYFYTLSTGEFTETRKMLIIK